MIRYAFTMIELIFVIVILGILAAVAIPKLAATRDDAKVASLKSDIHVAQTAVPSYFLSKHIASFTDAMNLEQGTWKLSQNDCTATFTDPNSDTVKMSIYNNANSAPSEACTGITSTDNNLSLFIKYDDTNGGSYVDTLKNTLNMQDTRIKLGGTRVVW